MTKNVNTALSFLLECIGLFVLGYWGFTVSNNITTNILAGIAIPLVAMLVWSVWCAPSSTHRLEGFWLVALKFFVFAFVVFALFKLNTPLAAMGFGALVVLNIFVSIHFNTL